MEAQGPNDPLRDNEMSQLEELKRQRDLDYEEFKAFRAGVEEFQARYKLDREEDNYRNSARLDALEKEISDIRALHAKALERAFQQMCTVVQHKCTPNELRLMRIALMQGFSQTSFRTGGCC